MKKIAFLLMVLVTGFANAQVANQVTLINTLTPPQIDSTLGTLGLPSGVFPITYGAKLYRVVYNTVSWDSTTTIASGLMVVPNNPPCKVGMLSYQHGTVIRKTDVPSNFEGEWFLALITAANGLTCVMPDYLGLGSSPGIHPYQHAHTEATAVVDLVRAAREVADSVGAPHNDQLFLTGYSQGGHATMAAHQLIQEELSAEMQVTASAPLSGAYSMSEVMADVMVSDSTYPAPYYLPYILLSYNTVYGFFNDISNVMLSPYDTLLPPLFQGNNGSNVIDNIMPDVPKLIMKPDVVDSFKTDPQHYFKVRLRENDTHNWVPNSPMRMYFCKGDKSVPYENAVVAYNSFVQQGATLVDTFSISETLDHRPCADGAILTAIFWLRTFAYQPLQGSISVTNATTANSNNGIATATATQGNPGYTYLWNTGDTTATITNLAPGKYYVTVTDENLCTYADSATVSVGTGLANLAAGNLRIYPNPATHAVTINWNATEGELSGAELINTAGQTVKTYPMQQGNQIRLLLTDEVTPGMYYVKVKWANGQSLYSKLLVQ